MLTIKADMRPTEQLITDLDRFSEKAYPYAVSDWLNTMAIDTHLNTKRNLQAHFTLRNAYTMGSLRYQRNRERKRVKNMESAAGSISTYMAEQEDGFYRDNAQIPTADAAGQEGGKRTKIKLSKNRLNRIKVSGMRNPYSGKQGIVVSINQAVQSNQRIIYLSRKRHGIRKGLYAVIGGKKVNRGSVGAKLRMIYDMEHNRTHTEGSHWLEKATLPIERTRDDRYVAALIKQIELQRLFKDKGTGGSF